MSKATVLILVLFSALSVHAGQIRELQCTAVLTVDMASGAIGGLQIRRELPLTVFTKKGSSVLADAQAQLAIEDVLGFGLVNVKASAFLYQDSKMAGLTLSISDDKNERVLASASGIILANKLADDSKSLTMSAPFKEALPATFLRNELQLPGNSFAEVTVTGAAVYCNLR